MKKTIILGLIVFGTTAFAAKNSFKVDVLQDSMVEGKMLKAGEYKITVENGNAMLKNGKDVIEVPAKEVNDTNKVASTELTYKDNTNLQEIRIGGTNTKIVFESASATQSGM
jgi:hypothetical protein